MKTICITGPVWSDLCYVADILETAGMESPQQVRDKSHQNIASWHEHVVAEAQEVSKSFGPITHFGRFWEQLASDIFLANISVPLWGWADPRSARLLDFWLAFEPRLNFLLVAVSPEHMLARAMEGDSGLVFVAEMLAEWQAQHEELLRFYHRNPDRALLVRAEECGEDPSALIELCASRWNVPLSVPSNLQSKAPVDPLALYLAGQLCREYPQTAGLAHELGATVIRFAKENHFEGREELPPEAIIDSFRRLRDRSAELQQLEATRAEAAGLIEEREAQQRRVVEFQSQLDKVTKDLAEMVHCEQALKNTQGQLKSSEKKLKDTAKENELLLLQLHQVQKEFEDYFLRHQEAQKQVEALGKEKRSLTQERDRLKDSSAALSKTLDAQKKLASDYQVQLQTAVKAREEQAKLANDRQAQLAKIQKDLTEMTRRAESLDVTQKQLKESERKLKDATQENELLLLQLHQVQEELEDYFLRHQEAQKQLQDAESRWQRMLQRHPDYCDYASVSASMLPNAEMPTIAWRFCNLDIAGRSLPEFVVDLLMEDGVAGFRFQRKEDGVSPLLRWPFAADRQSATIIPVVRPENARQRYETFVDLSATDWRSMQIFAQVLIKTLRSSIEVTGLEKTQREAFIHGLEKFLSIMAALPPLLRYDAAELKNEQVNPSYEHLWLHLKSMALNGKQYPDFEFRVSCANVCPDHFGRQPKLEFPETGGQDPFESWFKESSDDFGSKMELRFALPSDMDMDVWGRVSENDKKFLIALTNCLPSILRGIRETDVTIRRSWDDWMRMSQEMQRIIMTRVTQAEKIDSAGI